MITTFPLSLLQFQNVLNRMNAENFVIIIILLYQDHVLLQGYNILYHVLVAVSKYLSNDLHKRECLVVSTLLLIKNSLNWAFTSFMMIIPSFFKTVNRLLYETGGLLWDH